MPITVVKEDTKNNIVVVRKMRSYSQEPVFKNKAEKAFAFIEKHGLPDAFTQKKININNFIVNPACQKHAGFLFSLLSASS